MFEKLQDEYRRFQEVEAALADPAVLADPARVTALSRERGSLARRALLYGRYHDLAREISGLEELIRGGADADLREYMEEEHEKLKREQAEVAGKLRDLLYDQAAGADRASLIMEIRAGTGGDEAALFARDLYEMYRRYAERKGWTTELLALEPTELGGFREVSFAVRGEDAVRHLQFESGGHRVQRVPETEAQGRIHTSLATVAVLPEPEDVEIELKPDEIEMDVMRAGGPGGQHQNKTESAVRLTHLPTGLVVVCRDERSQHKNRAKAMRLLKSRLFDMVRHNAEQDRATARRTLIGSGDRSQRIRTYNFPQNRVTDHRIGLTLYQLDRVAMGDLDPLTEALIEHDRKEQLGDLATIEG